MLRDKSLTDLRNMAQSFSIPDIFQMEKHQLVQAIELKQQAMIPEPKVHIPQPEYDARLMTKPPARRSDRELVEELLQPYVTRGLRLSFDDERCYMSIGKKNDQISLRSTLRVVKYVADQLMKPSKG